MSARGALLMVNTCGGVETQFSHVSSLIGKTAQNACGMVKDGQILWGGSKPIPSDFTQSLQLFDSHNHALQC